MTIKVIGAGLGRTATFSLKFALEHIGFGPCYHMSEVFAQSRTHISLWIEAAKGAPDWEAIFRGFCSTTDFPAAMYWPQLADRYPKAKLILTLRDPDQWFESVSNTIFSDRVLQGMRGTPREEFFDRTIFHHIDGPIDDELFMTRWFTAWNERVIANVDPDRLLVFSASEGWEPLCQFLGVAIPDKPFPRINSRDEILEEGRRPTNPAEAERMAREYITLLRKRAFGAG